MIPQYVDANIIVSMGQTKTVCNQNRMHASLHTCLNTYSTVSNAAADKNACHSYCCCCPPSLPGVIGIVVVVESVDSVMDARKVHVCM